MLARGAFAVAFADLLFDFFGDLVNGRIQIAFNVFGIQIGSAQAQADRAGELFSGGAGMVVFQRYARVNGAPVKMVEFLDLVQDVIFDGPGQGDVVRRENQFHGVKMQPGVKKIQQFLGFSGSGLLSCQD